MHDLLTQDQPNSCVWAVLATLEHFGSIADPEEVAHVNSPPCTTCYLKCLNYNTLLVDSHSLQGGKTWTSNCNCIVNVLIHVYVLQGFCLATVQFNSSASLCNLPA